MLGDQNIGNFGDSWKQQTDKLYQRLNKSFLWASIYRIFILSNGLWPPIFTSVIAIVSIHQQFKWEIYSKNLMIYLEQAAISSKDLSLRIKSSHLVYLPLSYRDLKINTDNHIIL